MSKFNPCADHQRRQLLKDDPLGWDANIDLCRDNDTNVRYDIKDLADDYMEFMDVNDFVLLNHEPTRHWSNIDHFVTNVSNHTDNIITKHSIIADHDLVSLLFHTEVINDKPQFLLTRNWEHMNHHNLVNLINNDALG